MHRPALSGNYKCCTKVLLAPRFTWVTWWYNSRLQLVRAQVIRTYVLACACGGIHPGWVDPTVLRELVRGFHPVLSLSCAAKESRSRGRFQAFIGCRSPRLQLASRSILPQARRYGQNEVSDQLTLPTSRSVAYI